MKCCCRCRSEVVWFFAVMTTSKANLRVPVAQWENWFILSGTCEHTRPIVKDIAPRPVPDKERPAIEAKWEERSEQMFAGYTAAWTSAQRTAFRATVWPKPQPVIPLELFDRNKEEEPVMSYAGAEEEKHPFAE